MLENLFFWDDDVVIGISNAIMDDAEKWECDSYDDEEMKQELIDKLSQYDWEIVRCWYHPMGAWNVDVLVAKN